MAAATHPERNAVLKIVRSYFKKNHIHASTSSKKAFVEGPDGLPAICPTAIGNSTMCFLGVAYDSRSLRNNTIKRTDSTALNAYLTANEARLVVQRLQQLLGNSYAVSFTRTNKPTIHVKKVIK